MIQKEPSFTYLLADAFVSMHVQLLRKKAQLAAFQGYNNQRKIKNDLGLQATSLSRQVCAHKLFYSASAAGEAHLLR